MIRYRGSSSSGCMPFLIFLLVAGLFFVFLAGWTEGNMEWLFSKIAGRPVDVPYWLALVANLLTNVFGIAFNIICELAKLIWP